VVVFSFSSSIRTEAKEVLIHDSFSDIVLDHETMREIAPPAFLKQFERESRTWRQIDVRSETTSPMLLEGLSPHVLQMQVWIVSEGKLRRYEVGRNRDFAQRPIIHKNFSFHLPAVKGSYTVWIAVDEPEEGDVEFKIRSFQIFSEYAFYEYFLLGLYYGFLLIAGIYNAFLFLKSRIRLHLYYALYIVGCILLSLREDGMGFQFLWPSMHVVNELVVFHLASPLYLLSFLVYSIAFLALRAQKKILYPLYFLAFAYLFLEIFAFIGLKKQLWLNWIIAGISFLIYFSAIWQAKSHLYSRYFVIGYSMVIAGLMVNVLRYFAILPSNVFTVYIFNFGIIFEVIMFSVALGERVRSIQEERNEALSKLVMQLNENDTLQKRLIAELEEKKLLQDKVNRELEQKVRERTAELQETNHQLKEYSKKVEELNAALDIRNYLLKDEVKQAELSRINDELVSYAKFKEIFINEQQCLKVIEQLKWPQGFVCPKCGNTHGSKVKVWYRQKCTRCGTIESVTAHTLYHNVRIPLDKAFYITYLCFVQADKTLDEVAQEMELRKATAWLLRKKVVERLSEKKYSKAATWQELIVDRA